MKKIYLISYIIFLILFSAFTYLYVDKNLIYMEKLYSGIASSERLLVTICYVIFLWIFYLFYLFLLSKCKELSISFVAKLFIVTLIILLFSYPAILSFDIFTYIATSKIAFLYNENPYLITPIEFSNEPLLKFIHHNNITSPYGPVWILLSFIPYTIGFSNFLLTLLMFKVMISVFFIGTGIVLSKLTKDTFSLLFFLFNPLILIESLVSGHNDMVMVFFMMLSLLMLKKRHYIISFCMYIVSIFTKFTTVVLLPTYLYVIWKRYRKMSINWNLMYFLSALFMFVIFLLSAFRQEIYPWYAHWFLVFVALLPKNKLLHYTVIALTFGLMLRYVPFMYSNTHFGMTPIIRTLVTIIPPLITFVWICFKGEYSLKSLFKRL